MAEWVTRPQTGKKRGTRSAPGGPRTGKRKERRGPKHLPWDRHRTRTESKGKARTDVLTLDNVGEVVKKEDKDGHRTITPPDDRNPEPRVAPSSDTPQHTEATGEKGAACPGQREMSADKAATDHDRTARGESTDDEEDLISSEDEELISSEEDENDNPKSDGKCPICAINTGTAKRLTGHILKMHVV